MLSRAIQTRAVAQIASLRPSIVRSFTSSVRISSVSCASSVSSALRFTPSSTRSFATQSSFSSAAAARRDAELAKDDANDEVDEEDDDALLDEDEDVDDEEDYDDEEGLGDDPYSDFGKRRQRAVVGQSAPEWKATALMPGVGAEPGEFKQLDSLDYEGKWQVLFFYPLDFTFVCPTEIRAFSDRYEEFQKLGCEVIACSVDSEYSHLAWTQQPKTSGGLGPMKIPIVADITKRIARDYGVLIEDKGIALRGLFITDPKGILRQITINDLPIGRSVDETLRLIQALQHHEKHGEVCPAGWTPEKPAMQADAAGLKKYFGKK